MFRRKPIYHEMDNGVRVCVNDISVMDRVTDGPQHAGFNMILKSGNVVTYILEFNGQDTPKRAIARAHQERNVLWAKMQEI